MKRKKHAIDNEAMHEAGHAVAGVLLDRPFDAVTLERRSAKARVDGRPAVVHYVVGIVDQPGIPERRKLDRENGVLDDATAVCNMAGMAAEVAAGGSVDAALFGSETDVAYIRECVRAGGGSEEEQRETIASALTRAMDLLGPNWTAVKVVADVLLKRGRLAYGEVKVLVEAAREHDARSRGGALEEP